MPSREEISARVIGSAAITLDCNAVFVSSSCWLAREGRFLSGGRRHLSYSRILQKRHLRRSPLSPRVAPRLDCRPINCTRFSTMHQSIASACYLATCLPTCLPIAVRALHHVMTFGKSTCVSRDSRWGCCMSRVQRLWGFIVTQSQCLAGNKSQRLPFSSK